MKKTMCLFPLNNNDKKSKSYKYGITQFGCGSCPECLSKRSRLWALRACMEARENIGMMLTLTYDQYERDANGRIIGEKPADTRELSVRDCQLFIKRLRKAYPNNKIKYIIGAEHGKRTGRSHYHAVIFGLQFNDCTPYKITKRKKQIYLSKTLKKIWGHGICTVDSLNISASIARYCTKYCAKSAGVDDTFMLFSRGIGDNQLLKVFTKENPFQYTVEGQQYAIPRTIMRKYIEKKYHIEGYNRYVPLTPQKCCETRCVEASDRYGQRDDKIKASTAKSLRFWQAVRDNVYKKYESAKREVTKQKRLKRVQYYDRKIEEIENKGFNALQIAWERFHKDVAHAQSFTENAQYEKYKNAKMLRDIYAEKRDNDPFYKAYLEYWQKKVAVYKFREAKFNDKVLNLDDKRYYRYKQLAYKANNEARQGKAYIVPWSKSRSRYYEKYLFGVFSCHITPNDTNGLCKKCIHGVTFTECDEPNPFNLIEYKRIYAPLRRKKR